MTRIPAPQDRGRQLQRSIQHGLPVIYFVGVHPGLYRPEICYVVGEEPTSRTFHVVPASEAQFSEDPILRVSGVVRFERRYSIGG